MIDSPREVLRALRQTDARTVAVTGCSKNAGKTTALNILTAGWDRHGLMSIGIDGEDADFWLGVPKPRISAAAGTIFATAERALGAATVDAETIERTGVSTPLGEIVIARANRPGRVLLAGVRHKADVVMLKGRMHALGVERIAIDGAYQRLMSADPAVSDGMILVTGAVLGSTVEEVADRTMDFLARIRLPAVDKTNLADMLDEACRLGVALARDGEGGMIRAGEPGAAGAISLIESRGAAITHLAIPGSIPEGFTASMEKASPDLPMGDGDAGITIVVQDPTRVFLRSQELRWLARRGHLLAVAKPIRLLAVAVNPVSVFGGTLPSDELICAIRRLVGDIPVLDFVAADG